MQLHGLLSENQRLWAALDANNLANLVPCTDAVSNGKGQIEASTGGVPVAPTAISSGDEMPPVEPPGEPHVSDDRQPHTTSKFVGADMSCQRPGLLKHGETTDFRKAALNTARKVAKQRFEHHKANRNKVKHPYNAHRMFQDIDEVKKSVRHAVM